MSAFHYHHHRWQQLLLLLPRSPKKPAIELVQHSHGASLKLFHKQNHDQQHHYQRQQQKHNEHQLRYKPYSQQHIPPPAASELRQEPAHVSGSAFQRQGDDAAAAEIGGALLVLGDSRRRHAAKKRAAFRDREWEGDLQRVVRARSGCERERGQRFNHWDDGGGTWDCDTLGIEGADDCDLRVEPPRRASQESLPNPDGRIAFLGPVPFPRWRHCLHVFEKTHPE
ncbi:hypothetical protein VOLCADRAFT_86384 [Volvox carteri f. nagariensis]|uniref:Uncharacterized protein n=1 Tax=Volvox carteri f. nagariensis TaxID=3068 RepID=D8TIM5_VOLCA|nr:uncharacterized protein VOLCADRAFT_86384 [Volvox carteri f. nagariensis]EFJ53270.1 hypothetical protein VOLCADRAFT_86384 [Volvox carteri f. nagariensis]|eukprot:XP_002946275.1 hypothetical protein VOLCADRAFT_86384 [Volvox carteri f. nagariensis]